MSLVALALLIVTATVYVAAGVTYPAAIVCFCASPAMLALPQFGSDAFRVGALGSAGCASHRLLLGLGTAPLIGTARVGPEAVTPLIGAAGLVVLGIGSAGCALRARPEIGARLEG